MVYSYICDDCGHNCGNTNMNDTNDMCPNCGGGRYYAQ
jgi:DNA-directed RNA polymerase subunit RPC12/RpoP